MAVIADYLAMLNRIPETFRRSFAAVAIYDLDGRLILGNAAARALVGRDAATALAGRHFTAHLTPDVARRATRAFEECIATGRPIEGETTLSDSAGVPVAVRLRLVPARLDGETVGVIGFARDMREVRTVEQERRDRMSAREAKRVADLYGIVSASMPPSEKIAYSLDLACTELRAAGAYAGRISGASLEITHAAGKPVRGYAPGESSTIDGSCLRFPIDGEGGGALGFMRPTRRFHVAAADRAYASAIAALVGSAMQQEARERRLDTLAFHDSLTGLPNRSLLQDRLERALLAARRNGHSFAVHYVDVDHFKAINDTFGHHVGDGVLVAVARWLQATLRTSDTVARVGGDEFVVLQPEIDSVQQAEDLAAKLVAIRESRIQVGEIDVPVQISVGVAVYPLDGTNPLDMLCAADAALYEVKKRGRNGYAAKASVRHG